MNQEIGGCGSNSENESALSVCRSRSAKMNRVKLAQCETSIGALTLIFSQNVVESIRMRLRLDIIRVTLLPAWRHEIVIAH